MTQDLICYGFLISAKPNLHIINRYEHKILLQELLQLVRHHAGHVHSHFPYSVEISNQAHGGNGIGSLSTSRQAQPIGDAVYTYIMNSEALLDEIDAVECNDFAGFLGGEHKGFTPVGRGLLAGIVLAFCLGQKRWRVNYGPGTSRNPPTCLCVPYRAKDSPSLPSEFSYPDVVILLTCLIYYYSGLGDDGSISRFQPSGPVRPSQCRGSKVGERSHCTIKYSPLCDSPKLLWITLCHALCVKGK